MLQSHLKQAIHKRNKMRHTLEPYESFNENLLSWMGQFIRFKLNTLSNHQVHNKDCLLHCLNALKQKPNNLNDLIKICKMARNSGLIGINIFITPLSKLYEYLTSLNLISLKNIDEEILIDFISVHTANLSDASKKNYRIVLLGFFNFIDKNNSDGDNGGSFVFNITLPIKHLQRHSSGQKLPTYLDESELESFLKAIDEAPMPYERVNRDKLIIKIIVYTGVRVSEVLGLRMKDFIPQDDIWLFQVRGKGNKMRVVMIKKQKIDSLMRAWISQRGEIELKHKIEENLIFCNKNGGKLTQARVYQVLGEILSFAGIKKEKMGAHMLRHTFATMLYTKKHDLVLVQEALGHASLNTSRIYTHFDKERLMEAANIMDSFEKG